MGKDDFDLGALGNLGGLLSGFQGKLEEIKRKAAETEVTGTAGDGLVTVTVTGDFQVSGVTLKPDALADRELLEDLIRAATNEALRRVREETARSIAGGLPIPPGLF